MSAEDEDLVDDPLAVDPHYAEMTQEQLAEAARLAQERARQQWAKEEAEGRAEKPPEPESVAEIQARLARQQEAEREREERERALAADRARWEAERREQERKARIDAWDERMASLYPRFEKARVTKLDPPVVADVRAWMEAEHPGTLMLLGGTGSGKTFAAFAVLREMFLKGDRTRFWPVPNLLDVMRPGKEGDKHFEDARQVDALVLDDIGAEKRSDWVSERLYIVVNDRWLAQKRLIVTSNLALADLREGVGSRMYSRLREDATIVQLQERDRRLKKEVKLTTR